jgi:hypothetical protein
MADFTGSAGPQALKVGAFGLEVEIPTSGVVDLAKKVGRSALGVHALKAIAQWRTKQATESAWESLKEFSDLYEMSFRDYLQQGTLTKADLEQLKVSLEWEKQNPPMSPYPNTFILPSERRIQYSVNALKEHMRVATPLRSFGQYLEENPTLRDALLHKASVNWEKIQKVRKVVLSHARGLAKEGETLDETAAWETLAPEAMHLAKRFVLIADHPWTKNQAYKEEGTLYSHILRKEAWLKEHWKDAHKKIQGRRMDVNAFQDGVTGGEIQAWLALCEKTSTPQRMDALKKMSIAWEKPHAVLMALIRVGEASEVAEWIDAVKKQRALLMEKASKGLDEENAPRTSFDLNYQHEELVGYNAMDYALMHTPKEKKQAICEVLIKNGAVMDGFDRRGESECVTLMEHMGVDSAQEAKGWMDWAQKHQAREGGLHTRRDGKNEITLAVEHGKFEWAAAFLTLRKNEAAPITPDGKTWAEYWGEFKSKYPEKVERLEKQSPVLLGRLDVEAKIDVRHKMMPQMAQDYWVNLDEKLKGLQSEPHIGHKLGQTKVRLGV